MENKYRSENLKTEKGSKKMSKQKDENGERFEIKSEEKELETEKSSK